MHNNKIDSNNIANKNFMNCEKAVFLAIIVNLIRYSTAYSNIECVCAIAFHCSIVLIANNITTYIYDMLPTLKENSLTFYNVKNKLTLATMFSIALLSPTGLTYKVVNGDVIPGKLFFISFFVGGALFIICMYGAFKANISKKIRYIMFLTIACVFIPCMFEILYKQSVTSGIGFVVGLLLMYNMFNDGIFDMKYGTESFNTIGTYIKQMKNKDYKIIVFTLDNKNKTADKYSILVDLRKNFNCNTIFESDTRYAFIVKNINYADIDVIWKNTINNYSDSFECKSIVIDKQYLNDINMYILNHIDIESCISNFDDSNVQSIERREKIKQNLLSIVSNEGYYDDRLVTVIQPIINLKANKYLTGEMLTRLKIDEIDGLVMPYEFIPLLNELKCTHKFNLCVLDSACRLMRQIKQSGLNFDSISVNFDPFELTLDTFVTDVTNIVYKNGIQPSCIHIEITEEGELDNNIKTSNCIKELIELGFSIYLDDFGTKYSNLVELFNCNFDVIKIDRQLILKAMDNKSYNQIVSAISLAFSSVGYKVLYEGVDNEIGVDMANKNGASYIQGFYYSKPLSWNDFLEFIHENNQNAQLKIQA